MSQEAPRRKTVTFKKSKHLTLMAEGVQSLAYALLPGDVIDLEPFVTDESDPNYTLVRDEYVLVDSVNGGWADGAAGPDEVVIYSQSSLAEPVVIKRDALVTIDDEGPHYNADNNCAACGEHISAPHQPECALLNYDQDTAVVLDERN